MISARRIECLLVCRLSSSGGGIDICFHASALAFPSMSGIEVSHEKKVWLTHIESVLP